MVMRVFPVVGITAPRLPLEKSYTFFIVSPLFGVWLPHRDGSCSVTARSVNHDHQRPKYVHPNGHKALIAFSGVIFHGKREGIIQNPVALGERYAVLLDICRILFRVEIGGHRHSICTLYTLVNVLWPAMLSANVRDDAHERACVAALAKCRCRSRG